MVRKNFPTPGREDELQMRWLKLVKIKSAANPHDPQWEQYFEARWGKKMLNSMRGRKKLYRVWSRQDGTCPVCQERLTFQPRYQPDPISGYACAALLVWFVVCAESDVRVVCQFQCWQYPRQR